MKILLANKFYYNRGGDCIATLALEQLLKSHGHAVAFFAMNYADNFPSEWVDYFASEVNFSTPNIINKLKSVKRIFYSSDVKVQFTRLIDDFQPDIIHLNNIHSYLSPYIAEIAYKRGIKVIWTQHDSKLICPTYSMKREGICELCIKNTIHVLTKRCMKNSLLQSGCAYLESLCWNRSKLQKYTTTFIAPSDFMKRKMIEGGFDKRKIKMVPNCIPRNINDSLLKKENYYCFVGRLSEEKGIMELLEVAKTLPYQLIVVGDGPLKQELLQKADGCNNISFTGFKQWEVLKNIIGKARFLIVPSTWYEVFGLVSLEAQALGTPVLAANIGGLPETIYPGYSGELFESGNIKEMRDQIHKMFTIQFDYTAISNNVKSNFSMENYYNKIINIYKQALISKDLE